MGSADGAGGQRRSNFHRVVELLLVGMLAVDWECDLGELAELECGAGAAGAWVPEYFDGRG